MSQATTQAELEGVIAGSQSINPGARLKIHGDINHHHRYVRFFWQLHFADGRAMTGMDYGDVTADGKL